jgi:thiol-disulfide isomerase/thioredoxin
MRILLSLFILMMAHGAAEAQTAAPDFAVVSLDDSSALVSNAMLKGKVYLVDFWATWCPPCVEELPELSRLYEKYRGRNFEIVSLSLDNSGEQVRRFRAKRFAMPWLHGLVERGFGDYLAAVFRVKNIPRQVLVDSTGFIVAEDDELRGALLEKTLEKYLR